MMAHEVYIDSTKALDGLHCYCGSENDLIRVAVILRCKVLHQPDYLDCEYISSHPSLANTVQLLGPFDPEALPCQIKINLFYFLMKQDEVVKALTV